MNNHQVVLFLNTKTKRFSVTARKPNARLKEVIAAETQKGFIDITILRNTTKEAATKRAEELKAEWTNRGYHYSARQSLS